MTFLDPLKKNGGGVKQLAVKGLRSRSGAVLAVSGLRSRSAVWGMRSRPGGFASLRCGGCASLRSWSCAAVWGLRELAVWGLRARSGRCNRFIISISPPS